MEGVEDAGISNSVEALVAGEEGLGLSVVGIVFGMEIGGEVEKSVDGAGVGSLVLRVLLRTGDVVSGISGLLVGLASMETEVLEVLVKDVTGVVFSVVRGSTVVLEAAIGNQKLIGLVTIHAKYGYTYEYIYIYIYEYGSCLFRSVLDRVPGAAEVTDGTGINISFLTRALIRYFFTSCSLSSGWLPCYKESDEKKRWLSLGKNPV